MTKQITIFMCKSARKNSKAMMKTINVYEGNKFTKNNIYDLVSFIKTAYKSGYKVMRISAINDKFFIRSFNSGYNDSSFESKINDIFQYTQCLNLSEYDFKLSDLYNDSNIRFHINELYNK